MVTEFVNFKVLETTITDELLISKADNMINCFMKKQGGYIDAELVKGDDGNAWCFIYHFENLENVKAVGNVMRNSKEFNEFISIIVPGSISVTLYHNLRKW